MSSGLPVPAGTVVGGKYRVERLIGEGGMGIVLEATHVALGQGVALKALRSTVLGSTEAQRRFMREARATFALKSPHTVRLLDVDTIEPLGLVMVMELLRGQTLRQIIHQRAPLPVEEAVYYARQVCRALAEAHHLGVVHRDVKPSNVFVTEFEGQPWIKVLDFGLSKLLEPNTMSAPLTSPATTLGTPKYMAPEQWSDPSKVDARTDLYSLGAVLYQMLTGTVPFADVPADERKARMMVSPVAPPRALRPAVPEWLSRIVVRLLRPLPEERFADAESLEAALADPELSISTGIEETITTTVSTSDPSRSRAPTAPDVGEPPPTTEREPGWDVATTPKAKPDFDIAVFTTTKVRPLGETAAPTAPPSTARAPSTAAPFELVTEVTPGVNKARPLAETLKSHEVRSPLREALAPPIVVESAPPPVPPAPPVARPSPPQGAYVQPPFPSAAPGALGAPVVIRNAPTHDPARYATTGRVRITQKKSGAGRTFVIALVVAFVVGVGLAFLVYARN